MKVNIWQENLIEGAKAEEALKEGLHRILFTESVKIIKYGEDIFSTNLQRSGIDGIAQLKEVKWESKVREYEYYNKNNKDILIETVSNEDTGKPGWFYYSKADFIIYTWKNKFKNFLIDGFFIFIQNPVLRAWFEGEKDRFEEKEAVSIDKNTGNIWRTLNRVVPTKSFPKDTILHFSPFLSLDKQQIDLSKYLELNDPKSDVKLTKQMKFV